MVSTLKVVCYILWPLLMIDSLFFMINDTGNHQLIAFIGIIFGFFGTILCYLYTHNGNNPAHIRTRLSNTHNHNHYQQIKNYENIQDNRESHILLNPIDIEDDYHIVVTSDIL